MFVEAVSNLDDNVVEDKESKETSDAKNSVFNKVRKLFQITSNKKKIMSGYVDKLKAVQIRLNKLNSIESKLETIRNSTNTDIASLKEKFDNGKKLLESSLGDTN